MTLRLFPAALWLLTLWAAPAWANDPPDILSPAGDQTINEGQVLSIPFIVDEPDNDVVDDSVQ